MTSAWLLESGSEKSTKLILAYIRTVLRILRNESLLIEEISR